MKFVETKLSQLSIWQVRSVVGWRRWRVLEQELLIGVEGVVGIVWKI